jgi:hypothetical protein
MRRGADNPSNGHWPSRLRDAALIAFGVGYWVLLALATFGVQI